MGDSLKELLAAEQEAEEIVSRGERERDQIVQKALSDSAEMEQQFKDRLPELQRSFSEKAQQRAEQTIAELKLRYDERNKLLRKLAGKHEKEALEHAVASILGTGESSP
jgi:vacuolar-type H+-ATPase subunit H